MVEIVNLRQARKVRRRIEAEMRAEANRLKHGRSKAEMRLVEMTRQRQNALIDSARRERVKN